MVNRGTIFFLRDTATPEKESNSDREFDGPCPKTYFSENHSSIAANSFTRETIQLGARGNQSDKSKIPQNRNGQRAVHLRAKRCQVQLLVGISTDSNPKHFFKNSLSIGPAKYP